MRHRNIDRRLARVETEGRPSLMRPWPAASKLAEQLARWISTGTAPADMATRVQVVGTADAVLRGLEPNGSEHRTPRTCSTATLLELFQKGGSAEPVYLNEKLPPERPDPLPRAWRQFARDVEALNATIPEPPRGDVSDIDWSKA